MKAKEFMEQVAEAERELKSLGCRKRHYIELATSIGVKLSGMPAASGNHSKVEEAGVGLADLAAEVDAKIKEYSSLVHQAEALIARLDSPKHRQVLTLKYLCGMSNKSISDEMGYTDPDSVDKAKGWALYKLQKML